MMRQAWVVLACVCLAACGDGGRTKDGVATDGNTPAKPAPGPGGTGKPAPKEVVRQKPSAYDVQLSTGAGDVKPSVVSWSAKVPTGGWTMKTESVLVEETTGKQAARIWVIIEQPGPDEVVTQAEETLTGEHKDPKPIERVEFSVKVVVRGVDDPKRALYSVVKTIHYPFDTK